MYVFIILTYCNGTNMYYLPKNNGAHYVVKKCIKMANNRCSCQIRFFMFFCCQFS